ncbi:MAG: hypothetical protein JW966_13400 [Anaerolineae bacterium]|nr:hypothetical protein [Anaerolineae bacterium]
MRVIHTMRWLVLLAAATGLLAPWHVYAQDDDQPAVGRIKFYSTEVLFPAAIRFFVTIETPIEQITSITLTLRQENGLRETIVIDPQATRRDDSVDVTRLVYTWPFGGDPSPAFFDSLNYMWQIQLANNPEQLRVADEVLVQDSAHPLWHTAGEPPLILHWYNDDLAGNLIQSEVMAAYSAITQRAGRTPFFRFAIYDAGAPLCQKAKDPDSEQSLSVVISSVDKMQFPCAAEDFERAYAAGGLIFLPRQSMGYTELQDQLITIMARRTYRDLWQARMLPAWFENGLALLFRLRPNYGDLELARAAARTDMLYTLDDLNVPLPDEATFQQRALWDAQSYLFALYLAERFGADMPFDLALAVMDYDGGFEDALIALTGEQADTLWADVVNRWLVSEAADRAVGWSPYVAVTPTPTATPTATAIPPTFTPSFTPTFTLTPTSTFPGDQVPTVVVMRTTPTWSRPPTNTPLPPGSLPTAIMHTPAPAAASGDSDNTLSPSTGILAIIAAVGAALVLLGAGSLRRR